MSRLTSDGTTESVSRDQILRRERGQGNIHFPCSADHEQDWQPCPVDPYSCYMCDHTCILSSVAPVVQLVTSKPSDVGSGVRISVQSHELEFSLTMIYIYIKIIRNKWKTIHSWVHKIRLHGRRGKGAAESFSR